MGGTPRSKKRSRRDRGQTRDPLNGNVGALIDKAYDPPRMDNRTQGRILDSLKEKVRSPWVAAPAPAAESKQGGGAMTKSAEDSVLFSLKELRTIEKDRVRAEDHEQRKRREEEERARRKAERLRHEEEARLQREHEDEIRRAQQEREQEAREAQLRLQEAEIRARAEQEAQIEAERLRLEVETRATGGSRWPVVALVGCAALFVLGGAGVGYYLYRQSKEQKRLERIQLERERGLKKTVLALKQEQTRLVEISRKKTEILEKMRTAANEQKAKLALKMASLDKEGKEIQKKIRKHKAKIKKKGGKSGSSSKKKPYCDPNDPLCRIHD